MTILTITILLTMVIGLVFWKVFIAPLFTYINALSFKIRKSVIPNILELNKTIIAVSSASIVLTVQFFKTSDLLQTQYLVISWTSFLMSVLFGIILLLAYYTHRYIDEVAFAKVEIAIKQKKDLKNDPVLSEAIQILRQAERLAKLQFILIYLQGIMLLIALLSLVTFGIINLS